MIIARVSQLSGIRRERNIPVDRDKFHDWIAQGNASPLIQNAFPDLSDDDREFILTGVTPEEWDDMMGDEYDDQPLEDEPAF